ncbi:unnamed protein product [Gongylonema pulchrum]|uniref:Phlebovirus_G2 domain-containing protein n=1 Tax=Gongylonema pulchrum TaxID=637853 RepID=A0A183EG53_9BILA|nr:unnamed protein product [Gongylonema pulchrum]
MLTVVLTITVLTTMSYSAVSANEENIFCTKNCRCDDSETVYCEQAEFERIPAEWPSTLRVFHIINSSLSALHKNAFRRYPDVEEVMIEHCHRLQAVEKFAFKNLKRLK